jgi:hypothetical protein
MPYKDPENRKAHSKRYYHEVEKPRRKSFREANPLPSRRKVRTPEEQETFRKHIAKYQKEYKPSWVSRNKLSMLLYSAKSRAKRFGREFSLDELDIVVPEVCPYLKIPFTKENGMSLDRIDSSRGYTKDNVQVISRKANTMKNNATKEELIQFAKSVLELHDSNVGR